MHLLNMRCCIYSWQHGLFGNFCSYFPSVQLLQLVNCADTVVGDGQTRGISGGEKKRVTTGEIVVGPSKMLFMDEISTGAQPRHHQDKTS